MSLAAHGQIRLDSRKKNEKVMDPWGQKNVGWINKKYRPNVPCQGFRCGLTDGLELGCSDGLELGFRLGAPNGLELGSRLSPPDGMELGWFGARLL